MLKRRRAFKEITRDNLRNKKQTKKIILSTNRATDFLNKSLIVFEKAKDLLSTKTLYLKMNDKHSSLDLKN